MTVSTRSVKRLPLSRVGQTMYCLACRQAQEVTAITEPSATDPLVVAHFAVASCRQKFFSRALEIGPRFMAWCA